jgi:hypothetical protein
VVKAQQDNTLVEGHLPRSVHLNFHKKVALAAHHELW